MTITKNELDDIFYQGGPLEEDWEESDYDEAIRRVWDAAVKVSKPVDLPIGWSLGFIVDDPDGYECLILGHGKYHRYGYGNSPNEAWSNAIDGASALEKEISRGG